jgi:hypothetical protein
MARANSSSPVVDLERAILDCKRRDYNLEGIPMYLVLEDLTSDPTLRGAEGGRLGRLVADYLGPLIAERD